VGGDPDRPMLATLARAASTPAQSQPNLWCGLRASREWRSQKRARNSAP